MPPNHDYNFDLCQEKHRALEKDVEIVFSKLRGIESRLWGIVLLLVANLAGVLVSLVK